MPHTVGNLRRLRKAWKDSCEQFLHYFIFMNIFVTCTEFLTASSRGSWLLNYIMLSLELELTENVLKVNAVWHIDLDIYKEHAFRRNTYIKESVIDF